MKPTLLTTLLAFTVLAGMGQSKDTTAKYHLTEQQIIMLDQLLQVGDSGVATSDNFSRNQWKEYHAQVAKIDSVIRVQWVKWHPIKDQPKKEKK